MSTQKHLFRGKEHSLRDPFRSPVIRSPKNAWNLLPAPVLSRLSDRVLEHVTSKCTSEHGRSPDKSTLGDLKQEITLLILSLAQRAINTETLERLVMGNLGVFCDRLRDNSVLGSDSSQYSQLFEPDLPSDNEALHPYYEPPSRESLGVDPLDIGMRIIKPGCILKTKD